ncbi:hypothetical protein JCM11641_001437 [Rhodosporidiobolus odoratus]
MVRCQATVQDRTPPLHGRAACLAVFERRLTSSSPIPFPQLIFSVLKTLQDQELTVELKNDMAIRGQLKSVDQFLNIKLDNIKVQDEERYPHMVAVRNCFIRGSTVRYVQLPREAVDTTLLEDATRREAGKQR